MRKRTLFVHLDSSSLFKLGNFIQKMKRIHKNERVKQTHKKTERWWIEKKTDREEKTDQGGNKEKEIILIWDFLRGLSSHVFQVEYIMKASSIS